jgi:hypothetical protein
MAGEYNAVLLRISYKASLSLVDTILLSVVSLDAWEQYTLRALRTGFCL